MAEFIRLFPENPEPRKVIDIAKKLKDGAIIIYPTDTVYGLGCDIFHLRAIERIKQIKKIKEKDINLSFICYDLSHISEYVKQLETPTFKLMKRLLPGPYTFLLEASRKVPKILNKKKKTVGIRVPNNNIPRDLVQELGNPIISTSIHTEYSDHYFTDPEMIFEVFKDMVDIVIDGGVGGIIPSTVVDCTHQTPEVIRKGLGDVEQF